MFALRTAAICLVVLCSTIVRADEEDPAAELRPLEPRFLGTGFHAGWSAAGDRLVFGKLPVLAGLQIVDVATRKGRDLVESGKDPSWSPAKDGPIAYVIGNGQEEQVYVVEADGTNPRKLAGGGCPHWSPDGSSLYFNSPATGKLRIWNVGKKEEPQDFCEQRRSWYPKVSPDAKQVAFVEQGQFAIINVAGGENVFVHKLPGASGGLVNWSSDGKWIAFGGYGIGDRIGLWLLDVEKKKVAHVLKGPFTLPAFAPDGARLAIDLRVDQKRHEVWTIATKKLRELEFTDPVSE